MGQVTLVDSLLDNLIWVIIGGVVLIGLIVLLLLIICCRCCRDRETEDDADFFTKATIEDLGSTDKGVEMVVQDPTGASDLNNPLYDSQIMSLDSEGGAGWFDTINADSMAGTNNAFSIGTMDSQMIDAMPNIQVASVGEVGAPLQAISVSEINIPPPPTGAPPPPEVTSLAPPPAGASLGREGSSELLLGPGADKEGFEP